MSKPKRSARAPAPRKTRRRAAEGSALGSTAPSPAAEGSAAGSRPLGQRLWDMPYSAAAPRMINPGIGLHNLVARAGHNAGYDIDVTLLDAPDHRLIRSGVLLAHRVLDGRGEWYLGAPDWVPLLPKERIDPMSQADLPEELADLVRPFRRRATLGPVAALRCERREFALRDDRGTTMALVRDDKVTVRRGGLTTARYREVTLTPVGPGLTEEQDFWLRQVLGTAGATLVEKFPRLVTRLGAPSNGLTDFPIPGPIEETADFGTFATGLLRRRLRELLEADLAVRAGSPDAIATLGKVARRLRDEIAALGVVLDPDWAEDLAEELAWVSDLAVASGTEAAGIEPAGIEAAGSEPAGGSLRARLRSERYLTLLEQLVTAARGARAGSYGPRPMAEVMQNLLAKAQRRLARSAERMSRDGSVEAGDEATAAVADLLRLKEVIDQVEAGRLDPVLGSVHKLQAAAGEARRSASVAYRTRADAVSAAPLEAFELGRRYEREQQEARVASEAFRQQWTRTARKLDRALAKRD